MHIYTHAHNTQHHTHTHILLFRYYIMYSTLFFYFIFFILHHILFIYLAVHSKLYKYITRWAAASMSEHAIIVNFTRRRRTYRHKLWYQTHSHTHSYYVSLPYSCYIVVLHRHSADHSCFLILIFYYFLISAKWNFILLLYTTGKGNRNMVHWTRVVFFRAKKYIIII